MARILVVDDEKSMRVTLREILKDADYDVEVAKDADQAMRKLTVSDFDVVLTDIIMPRVTGITLLQKIRGATPSVQIILLTGDPTVDTASEAVRAGAFDYLTKPVRRTLLLKTVAAAVRLKTVDDERRLLAVENRKYQENLEQLVEERTEALRESERQFYVAQKAESLGRLAGGIAHDFNNILTTERLAANVLKRRLGADSELVEVVDELIASIDKGAALGRQLLAVSRRQVLDPVRFDLSGAVSELANMVDRIVGSRIQVAVDLGQHLPFVEMDRSQFDQIFMNLVVNARDAMPDGGKLQIRLSETEIDKSSVSNELAPGLYVAMKVADTGNGISAETLPKIFDPFFTTKSEQEGTGLGLSTVQGIVSQSGGLVTVETELEVGTTFTVLLPTSVPELGKNA